ncbi:hypothetical protein [Pandoravirus japonicus]|uniref:Uncharacterized protein n=1 Tax=Pandoravirus japonicus TaxID=2823154 RepID=A0A811BLK1_9VIRU|nr:hypothetical protein [Pandoravirus japonicus]
MQRDDRRDPLAPDRAASPATASLRALAATLKALAKARLQNSDVAWRATTTKTTAGAAEAIRRRFPGPHDVRDDWERLVRRHAHAEADPLGLCLCIESVKGLGVTVHGVRPLDPNVTEDGEHLPADLDDMRRRSAPWRSPQAAPSDSDPSRDEPPTDRETQLVFWCGAPPRLPDKDGRGSAADRPVLAVEIRMGLGRRPWASAGHVVNLATGDVITLGCTLVCDPGLDTHQDVRQGTLRAQRRLLADFLASGETAWRPFAARRYANVRRLPRALVARGWTVKDGDLAEWSWDDAAGPTAELSLGPSLSLSRPDVPVTVSVRMMDAHLIVSSDSHWRYDDCTQIDWPTLFAADSPAQAFYGDIGFVRLHRCEPPSYYGAENAHFDAVAARQRERLVAMGLVSARAISGRKGRFCDREPTNQKSACGSRGDIKDAKGKGDDASGDDDDDDSCFGAHVLVDADAPAMADAIEAYVAQNIFGEYGPVEADSGRRLHGGLCDDLLDQAVSSGRLWAGLAHIGGAHHATAEAIVHVTPSALDVENSAVDQPRLVVNWRAKCVPTTPKTPCRRGQRMHLTVWAAALVQSDGRGGACVAVTVPKAATWACFGKEKRSDEGCAGEDPTALCASHPPGYYAAEHDIDDAATLWQRVLDRCAHADPAGYPPDLHPALVAVLDTERECGKRACFVPWAYRVDTLGNPVDARSLASWIIDCVVEIFAVLDSALDAAVAMPIQDTSSNSRHPPLEHFFFSNEPDDSFV